MFTFAEYLAWVEVLRRGVHFLDLGDDKQNRKLVEHLTSIRRVLLDKKLDTRFWVFQGRHQRAIGELMLTPDRASDGRGWECIGFAEFCSRLDQDERFARWFQRLEADVVGLASHPGSRPDRLVELQDSLTALIDFLDPARIRFPLRRLPWHGDEEGR
jgi:hypothetical protein